MKRLERLLAWCRREGTLDAWPRKIRQVLRTLACEHSFTLCNWCEPIDGLISRYILPDRQGASSFNLKCRCCNAIVARVTGDSHVVTFPPDHDVFADEGLIILEEKGNISKEAVEIIETALDDPIVSDVSIYSGPKGRNWMTDFDEPPE